MTGLDLLGERRSVRSYLPESLSRTIRTTLESEATYINSHEAGLNFRLVFDDENPFKGFRNSYGMFRNTRNYLTAIIDPTFPDAYERAGYYGQQFVMKALELGIGSCFIGGTFSRDRIAVRMEIYERLPFIIAFGYPGGEDSLITQLLKKFIRKKNRELRKYFIGTDTQYAWSQAAYPWLMTGLEGLSYSPSASNRQPIRIGLRESDGRSMLYATSVKGKSPIDLGIAKFNFRAPLPVETEWEWGDGGVLHVLE